MIAALTMDNASDAATGALSGGLSGGLTWIGLTLCVLAGLGVLLQYSILARVRGLESRIGALGHLSKIETMLTELAHQPADLDLRRLEHVLIDIRDGQRRVESRTLAVLEYLQAERVELTSEGAAQSGTANLVSGPHLVDRIISRLLALGFERIEFLTPADELPGLFESGGDVLVEARRGGAPYKGRVFLQGGSIADVQLRPSYQIFP